jgi:DNA repair protein RadD
VHATNGSGPLAARPASEPREFCEQPSPRIPDTAHVRAFQVALRPHQVDLVQKIDAAIAAGCRRIIAQAATGFGKTIVAAALISEAIKRRKRVIFVVPALSLIDQTVERFFSVGITDLGVIQSNHFLTDYAKPVQIASLQTLQRRWRSTEGVSRSAPPADVAVIDEIHRRSEFYDEWLSSTAMSNVPVIGLSATPWTKGLGKHFDKLIIGASTQELIDGKYLAPFRVFAPASPDLSAVRTVRGDYDERDLSKAIDKATIVADVVDTWLERGQRRPTLCFAVDRVHAKHLQAKFQAAGIVTAYIDAYTPTPERNRIAKAFHRGDIKVVCNVGCLTTGIDWDVRCIVLARPTKSEMLFVQMVGRGLRTADGKADCLILDHSDNHTRLGFVTDIHHLELDDGASRLKSEAKPTEALPKKCPECAFVRPANMLACPACGFVPTPKCTVVNAEGELIELTDRRTVAAVSQAKDKIRFFQELKCYAGDRGYKQGWAAYKFKEKFGHWPNGLDHLTPVEPSTSTLSWIKSKQIAYARERATVRDKGP